MKAVISFGILVSACLTLCAETDAGNLRKARTEAFDQAIAETEEKFGCLLHYSNSRTNFVWEIGKNKTLIVPGSSMVRHGWLKYSADGRLLKYAASSDGMEEVKWFLARRDEIEAQKRGVTVAQMKEIDAASLRGRLIDAGTEKFNDKRIETFCGFKFGDTPAPGLVLEDHSAFGYFSATTGLEKGFRKCSEAQLKFTAKSKKLNVVKACSPWIRMSTDEASAEAEEMKKVIADRYGVPVNAHNSIHGSMFGVTKIGNLKMTISSQVREHRSDDGAYAMYRFSVEAMDMTVSDPADPPKPENPGAGGDAL